MRRFRWISTILFGASCFAILWCTIISRHPTRRTGIIFGLFWSYRRLLKGDPRGMEFVRQNISNIALFIPFGFFIPLKKYWIVFVFSALVSLAIEVNQYIWRLGFCELDDLICNCFGAILGVWLYKRVLRLVDYLTSGIT